MLKAHKFSKFTNLLLIAFLLNVGSAFAAKTDEIDAKVKSTLETFYAKFADSKEFVQSATGILVFPEITKAGFILGGEYGEGALVVNGYVDSYYSMRGASVGFQAGVQVHSQIILFLTEEALSKFRNSTGWEYGAEGGVAIASEGIGGQIDNRTLTQPVVVYVFDNKGLMAAINLGASKVSRLK